MLGPRRDGAAASAGTAWSPTTATRSRPSAATCARPATCSSTCRCWWCWSASRSGSLFGYKGGVILVGGQRLLQQPHAVRRLRARAACSGPTTWSRSRFDVDDFDVDWLTTGPRTGMAQRFDAAPDLPRDARTAEQKTYDLRVNHPLTIGGTEVFLIGHGYAPVITVRDGNGDVAYSGPAIFLPQDQRRSPSFGVVKAPDARPTQIGLEGVFYPTYAFTDDDRTRSRSSATTATRAISMLVYTGDLGHGRRRAAVGLRRSTRPTSTLLKKADGKMFRVDLLPGQTVKLPDGARLGHASTASSAGARSRSAARPARASRSPASCWRCSACSARCSSGRAGSGCAPAEARVRRHTGRGGRPRPVRRRRRRRRAATSRGRPAGRTRRRRDEEETS